MRLAPLAAALLALPAFSVPARAANLANGESIVRNICASCHGFPPVGGPETAPNNPTVISNAINSRVPAMFFLKGVLSTTDIDDVAAYLGVLFAAPTTSYQGLWLKTPFESESGWGINFTHGGTTLFATWFTYDVDGSGMWLVMSNGAQVQPGKFTGDLYRTTAPGSFDTQPFPSISFPANYTQVGTLTVLFSDGNNGEMTYTVNGVTATKPIARYVYAANPPTCTLGGTPGPSPNYQDLWWASPAGSESGWGVNITHQGDILFATWFTYQAGGKGMWLVMSNGNKTGDGVYAGDLQRTTGPNAFSATTPFNPNLVQRTTVGNATFTFSDANSGTFRYTVNGITQTKNITRLAFASPVTVCK
jgi:hypothetical protein